MTGISNQTKQQREYCKQQISITYDRKLTVWGIGGFVPTKVADAVAYMERNSAVCGRAMPKSDTQLIQKWVREENTYRCIYVHKVNTFLEALRAGQPLGTACRECGIPRVRIEIQRTEWEALDELWYEIEEEKTDILEATAFQRATSGWDEPVFHNGRECGSKRKFSDSLLSLMLAGRMPETYNLKGKQPDKDEQGKADTSGVMIVPSQPGVDDWTQAAAAAQAKLKDEVRK